MYNIKKIGSLELLQSLIVFCESPNIVEASRRLGLSQPMLSKQLKSLEQYFSSPLFEYQGRKKIPTPLGQALKDIAARNFNQLSEDLKSLDFDSSGLRKVRIGARREILKDLCKEIRFEGSLDFLPLRGSEIARDLKSGTLDIAIAQLELDSTDLIRKKIFSDHWMIAWSKNIEIKGQNCLAVMKELQTYRCMDYGESSILKEVCRYYSVSSPTKISVIRDWNLIVEAIEERNTWGCVPSHQLRGGSLVSLPLDTRKWPPTQFYIYYSRRMIRFVWFKQLIDQIVQRLS